MIWTALAITALLIGDRADNEPGRIILWVFGTMLFALALLTAPWSAAIGSLR